MKRSYPNNFRPALKAFVLVGLGISLLIIYLLTEQTPEETTQLSSFVAHGIYSALSFIGISLQPDSLPFLNKLLRRLAHTAEFFVVGFFVALAVLLWFKRRFGSVKCRNLALGICVGLSLFDQTHKLFVVGREFDVLDLAFDAAGYLLALLVVMMLYRVVKDKRKDKA